MDDPGECTGRVRVTTGDAGFSAVTSDSGGDTVEITHPGRYPVIFSG